MNDYLLLWGCLIILYLCIMWVSLDWQLKTLREKLDRIQKTQE